MSRWIWTPPRGHDGHNTPLPRIGRATIDAGTVARIVQNRAAVTGFDPAAVGSNSLKRGVHPTRFRPPQKLRRPRVYLELGDPFESHPLITGVL